MPATMPIILRAVCLSSVSSAYFSQLPPLSATLYKRLYLHFSNLYQNKHDATSLSFEKDYAAICAEWFGGLKTMSYKFCKRQATGSASVHSLSENR